MNVIDLPKPARRASYEEAVSRYAAAVKGRAVGVHLLGNVRYPGLSGIDLLVVTDHVGVDNRYFFSALHRLPERYHALFVREPYILPAWSLRVMRHTAHYATQLVAGRNVLAPYTPNDEPAERWCRVLESYCAHASFAAAARTSQLLRGRATVAAACAFRTLLSDAAAIVPEATDESYVNQTEAICRTFFQDGSDPVERVRAAWKIFTRGFDRFDAIMRARLNAHSTEQAVSIARARLAGEQDCADIDRDYAFRRSREIDGYHQELASLGFPYGQLFHSPAYPIGARIPARVPLVDALLQNVYRVRRRLTEYAAGV